MSFPMYLFLDRSICPVFIVFIFGLMHVREMTNDFCVQYPCKHTQSTEVFQLHVTAKYIFCLHAIVYIDRLLY